MQFAGFTLRNNLFVAPMAGVTDRPFRQLCKKMGAGLAVSEMVTSNSLLYGSAKTQRRANHDGEADPISVQIAGADPAMMAEAARHNIDRGAQIIDINMGCPAKKVCNVMAGSALMAEPALALAIVEAVAAAVDVPVTVKMRTGPTPSTRNAAALARDLASAGAAMIAVHGRSRACAFLGHAEYDTIAEVKRAVRVPVVANGDVDSPAKAAFVLARTGADAVMIGRAAQGRPWIFREIEHFLATGELLPPPLVSEIHQVCREHLADLYAFYGDDRGVKIARKHISWYTKGLVGSAAFRRAMNQIPDIPAQLAAVDDFFGQLAEADARLRYEADAHPDAHADYPQELAA